MLPHVSWNIKQLIAYLHDNILQLKNDSTSRFCLVFREKGGGTSG
jgi:hypothetical protein